MNVSLFIKKTGYFLALVLFLVMLDFGCAHFRKGDSLTQQQMQLELDSFDYIWTKINDTWWDADMGGVDWQGARDKFRPLVAKAKTRDESRKFMWEMVSLLEKSHFAIIPSLVYEEMASNEFQQYTGDVGIVPCIINGQVYVEKILESSSADSMGVKPGWKIVSVRGKNINATLQYLDEKLPDRSWKKAKMSAVIWLLLMGKPGDILSVDFIDKYNQKVALNLLAREPEGNEYQIGYLPKMKVRIKTDSLVDNIGYIHFNAFLDPAYLMPQINSTIKSFLDAPGMIIDLRGNGGGLGDMAMGIAGWFIDAENQYFGTMYTRQTNLKLIVYPRPDTFQGPLVILVNELSASASEFLAGGLQGLGRAKVFGCQTAGAALPSVFERLPNGDGFQYAFAKYISKGGDVLEGKGVTPDMNVFHTRQSLLAGKDVVLEAAIEWIQNQNTLSKLKNGGVK